MSQFKATKSWRSSNEIVVTEREHKAIAELNATDERIGAEVAAKFGRGVLPKRSIPFRLMRRAFYEVKKVVGPVTRKAQRVALRHWNRRIADKIRIADGHVFESNGIVFQVLAIDGDQAECLDKALSCRVDFLVLTRQKRSLLRSALPKLVRVVGASEAQMWIADSRNEQGVRTYRPTFTRLLLRQADALGPIVVVRSSVLRDLISDSVIEPTLWPLALGLHIDPANVEVVPEVLGVGESTQSGIGVLSERACELVQSELKQSGIAATVQAIPLGRRDVRYVISGQPLISIVIPTRGTVHDGRAYVVDAVRSIIEKSSYLNYELVIVADEPTPQSVVDDVDRLAGTRVRWVRWSEPFNFSNKMNLGAVCASGEYLLVLNDDIEVVSADWIERMVSLLGVDDIGHAGALLFFENQTIQHAGHFHRRGAGHVNFGESMRLKDPNQLLVLDQLRAGVTAACSALTRELFFDIGGFSPQFPGNYNDVDLSCKVRNAGLLNAVSGHARLYHFESITRDAQVQRFELERLFSRWWRYLEHDEYSRGQ